MAHSLIVSSYIETQQALGIFHCTPRLRQRIRSVFALLPMKLTVIQTKLAYKSAENDSEPIYS